MFPCAVTVLGGFGGQGTRHCIPTDGPKRLNTRQQLNSHSLTPDRESICALGSGGAPGGRESGRTEPRPRVHNPRHHGLGTLETHDMIEIYFAREPSKSRSSKACK